MALRRHHSACHSVAAPLCGSTPLRHHCPSKAVLSRLSFGSPADLGLEPLVVPALVRCLRMTASHDHGDQRPTDGDQHGDQVRVSLRARHTAPAVSAATPMVMLSVHALGTDIWH